jgi:hypothetical protein
MIYVRSEILSAKHRTVSFWVTTPAVYTKYEVLMKADTDLAAFWDVVW